MKILGPVGKHIEGKEDDYKSKYKATELSKCKVRKFDGVEIVRLYVGEKDQLCVHVRGQKHRFDYYNPPILIPEGTATTYINEFGIEADISDFKEDLEESLKILIRDTLKAINKKV